MDLVTNTLMSEIMRRIVREAHPERVILFGSRAHGDYRQDSDIDLLVVTETALREGSVLYENHG